MCVCDMYMWFFVHYVLRWSPVSRAKVHELTTASLPVDGPLEERWLMFNSPVILWKKYKKLWKITIPVPIG